MKRFIILTTLLALTTGCPLSKDQQAEIRKRAREYVTQLAFNKLADLADEQITKAENKLASLNIPAVLKPPFAQHLTDLRELTGEARKVRNKLEFDELAVHFKKLYSDIRFDVGNLGDDIRGQLSSLFDGIGSVVEPLEEPVGQIGGDRAPINANANVNP